MPCRKQPRAISGTRLEQGAQSGRVALPQTERKPDEQGSVPEEWVTLAGASREAKCSRLTLMQEAFRRDLVTEQRAGFWFVERASLDAFIARRKAARSTKAPRKQKAHR